MVLPIPPDMLKTIKEPFLIQEHKLFVSLAHEVCSMKTSKEREKCTLLLAAWNDCYTDCVYAWSILPNAQ